MRAKNKDTSLLCEKGFTLVELIVTLAVIATLAAIAVPGYLALQPGQRLNGGAREVLSKLRWARAQAVVQSTTFAVTFPDNNTLQIFNDQNNNGLLDAGEWSQSFDISTNYPGVTLSPSGGTPTFDARGTAGGSAIVTVSNTTGSRIVTVSATGNVKID